MNLYEVQKAINSYYLDSEKDVGLNRQKGVYPNAILLTKEQYVILIKELFKLVEDISEDIIFEVKILSIEGLQVVFTEHVEEPKVLYLRELPTA
jgi:hypothetical protein